MLLTDFLDSFQPSSSAMYPFTFETSSCMRSSVLNFILVRFWQAWAVGYKNIRSQKAQTETLYLHDWIKQCIKKQKLVAILYEHMA